MILLTNPPAQADVLCAVGRALIIGQCNDYVRVDRRVMRELVTKKCAYLVSGAFH